MTGTPKSTKPSEMKKVITVNGEAVTIEVAKITLLYDGAYGLNVIECPEAYVIDGTSLRDTYPQLLEDERVAGWVSQPTFVYAWWLIWGKYSDHHSLPCNDQEFIEASSDGQFVFAMLSAVCSAIVQQGMGIIEKGRPIYIKRPEHGLHPAIQAGMADMVILFTNGTIPKYLTGLSCTGRDMIKVIEAQQKLGGNRDD